MKIRKTTRKSGCFDCGAHCGSNHKIDCPWRYTPEPGSKANKTKLPILKRLAIKILQTK